MYLVSLCKVYKMCSRSVSVYPDMSASHEYLRTLIQNGYEFCKLRCYFQGVDLTSHRVLFVLFVPHSWVSRLTHQAVAQLIGDPRYLRFNVLIREDAKGSPFTDVNAKTALSPQLF